MGYTTEFKGQIKIDPPLNDDEISFLKDLAETRRMIRSNGPLFVGGGGFHGQSHEADIFDYNCPNGERPYVSRQTKSGWEAYVEENGQPSLWLQWTPDPTGRYLEWDGGEKFYDSVDWMRYLIDKLLSKSAGDYLIEHCREDARLSSFTYDHVLNGEIFAQGEDPSDVWKLIVKDNVVTRQVAKYQPMTFTEAKITWD